MFQEVSVCFSAKNEFNGFFLVGGVRWLSGNDFMKPNEAHEVRDAVFEGGSRTY